MKRMIDNKEYEALKKEVNDINEVVEEHTTDYVITNVVLDDDNNVLGSQVKDVENDVTYNLPLGSQVEANPTLEGTESDLEGIKIDGTKYKIGGGKQLYQHNLTFINNGDTGYQANYAIQATIICDSATPFTLETLAKYLYDNNIKSGEYTSTITGLLLASGNCQFGSSSYMYVAGICSDLTYTNGIRIWGAMNASPIFANNNRWILPATFIDTVVAL